MIAVIGDIHGCAKSFDALLNVILSKYDISRFIILGDFVDRGKNSLEVTKTLQQLSKDFTVTLLRGNHEDMLIDYIKNENRYPKYKWQERVGLSAIRSFSGGRIEDITDLDSSDIFHYFAPYIPFMENSWDYMEESLGGVKFLFSHSGVAFNGVAVENQYDYCSTQEREIKHPFLWSREIMKFTKPYFNSIVVHGHIPLYTLKKGGVKTPLIRNDEKGNIININLDTGCVYGGNLSAMLIDNTGKYEFETVKCTD